MTLLKEYALRAAERLEKIAVITERSQMSHSDVLGMVACFDAALAARGVQVGQTLVLVGRRAEFTLPMTLLASLRSYRVIFSSVDAVLNAGIAFDWVLSVDSSDAIATDRQIRIEADWFPNSRTIGPPKDVDALPERDGQLVFNTSGSTGEPKFVETSIQSRMENALRDGPGFVGVEMEGRRFCSTLPSSASWAMMGNLSALLAGGSLLSLSQFNASLISYIDLYRIDTLVTTPIILKQLLNLPQAEAYLSSLKDVRVGGALTSTDLARRFTEKFGTNVHIGYGSTEFGFTLGHIYDPKNPPPDNYLGAPANDQIEVGLFDQDYVKLPDDATEGIVGLSRKNQTPQRSYIGTSSKDGSREMQGGVFFPGDILRRHGDGFIFAGRTKNIVNVGGNKYSLDLIASYLSGQFPTVQMAPIVEADEDAIEKVVIVVAGKVAPDHAEIEAALRSQFTGLSVARVEMIPVLPLTATNKIDFAALKAAIK